jgi:two-component system, response regulator YesN
VDSQPFFRSNRRVTRAIDLVMRDLTQRISRRDAARAANLEPAYFSKYFRKVMGVSFSSWTTLIRIEAARRLLESSDERICAVAAAVGYDDITTFERNFRKHTGKNPRSYRASNSTDRSGAQREHETPKEEHKTTSVTL